MRLSERQRKMVRLAFTSKNGELRRAVVQRLALVAKTGEVGVPPLPAAHGAELLGPVERRLVRLAYASPDPVLRRGIVESIRLARYSKDFMQAVEGQKFHNPDTGNKVKFVSLPAAEQQKVYEQWASQQQQQPEEGAQQQPGAEKETPSLQQVKPGHEAQMSAHAAVRSFFPQAVHSLEEAKKLHAAGKPWHMPAVASGAKGKMKFWEASGDGDTVQLRFGPVGWWSQAKPMKSVEDAWKRYQSKIDKGYMSAGPSLAMSFSAGPVGLDTDKLWKEIEAKHGSDPKMMAETVRAALDYLTQLDTASEGKWDSVKAAMKGLEERYEKSQAKGEKAAPKKPEAPKAETQKPVEQAIKDAKHLPEKAKDAVREWAAETGASAHDVQDIDVLVDELSGYDEPVTLSTKKDVADLMRWNNFDAVESEYATGKGDHSDDAIKEYAKDQGVGEGVQDMLWIIRRRGAITEAEHHAWKEFDDYMKAEKKPKTPKEPEKAEAPPTGKHKDRKELRAKPKAKMSDSVSVTTELTDLVLPESMDAKKREQAKKQLEGASYQLLAQLRDNAAEALKNPKGKYMKALLGGGYTEEGVQKMHAALVKSLVPAEGKKYHPDVLKVANQYDLEAEDADEIRDFKADKPSRGKKLTPQELFTKFMAKAKPETKERMQGMAIGDFMAMYNAIMAEEEEGEAAVKTASRLPQQRHDEVSRAIQEGRLAVSDDEESLTIFDAPPKKRGLSAEDRAIVRLAHASQDRTVRRELLSLLSL